MSYANPVSFILSFIVSGLAIYRVARMISRESGTFDLFLKFRQWVYDRTGNGWINEGVNCCHCWGFWIALPIGIYFGNIFYLDWFQTIVVWLALSGFTSFLYSQERTK